MRRGCTNFRECLEMTVFSFAYGAMNGGSGTTPFKMVHEHTPQSFSIVPIYAACLRALSLAGLVALGACANQPSDHNHRASAPWQLQRGGSTNASAPNCVLASAPQPFVTGVGLDHVRVRIHSDGLVSLQSDHDPFDLAVRDQMGIQVKGHAPMLAPRVGSSPKELTFSSEMSAKLLEQLANGSWARIQVALVPRKEMLTAAYSLEGFDEALKSYRVCEVFRAKQEGNSPAYQSTHR